MDHNITAFSGLALLENGQITLVLNLEELKVIAQQIGAGGFF